MKNRLNNLPTPKSLAIGLLLSVTPALVKANDVLRKSKHNIFQQINEVYSSSNVESDTLKSPQYYAELSDLDRNEEFEKDVFSGADNGVALDVFSDVSNYLYTTEYKLFLVEYAEAEQAYKKLEEAINHLVPAMADYNAEAFNNKEIDVIRKLVKDYEKGLIKVFPNLKHIEAIINRFDKLDTKKKYYSQIMGINDFLLKNHLKNIENHNDSFVLSLEDIENKKLKDEQLKELYQMIEVALESAQKYKVLYGEEPIGVNMLVSFLNEKDKKVLIKEFKKVFDEVEKHTFEGAVTEEMIANKKKLLLLAELIANDYNGGLYEYFKDESISDHEVFAMTNEYLQKFNGSFNKNEFKKNVEQEKIILASGILEKVEHGEAKQKIKEAYARWTEFKTENEIETLSIDDFNKDEVQSILQDFKKATTGNCIESLDYSKAVNIYKGKHFEASIANEIMRVEGRYEQTQKAKEFTNYMSQKNVVKELSKSTEKSLKKGFLTPTGQVEFVNEVSNFIENYYNDQSAEISMDIEDLDLADILVDLFNMLEKMGIYDQLTGIDKFNAEDLKEKLKDLKETKESGKTTKEKIEGVLVNLIKGNGENPYSKAKESAEENKE